MTKAKRKLASRTNDSKAKTRNSLKRTAARKAGQLKPVMTAAHQQPRSASQPTARRESKKAHIIAMLHVPGGVTIQAMARAANWQPHSVRGFLAGVVRRKLGLNLISAAGESGASIGLPTARHLVLPRPRRAMRLSAMKRTRSIAPKATRLSLDDEIAHLRDLDLHGLRARWKSMFRQQPPPHLPRHLLFAVLAYRLQADELGDLDPTTARLLRQIAATGGGALEASQLTEVFGRRRTELKPGTILMREWNAQAYRVMVVDEGFAWNGKTYDSLSKVAFAITGTNWNGPRFFGLRDKISPEATS